jgi:hypothetical protein
MKKPRLMTIIARSFSMRIAPLRTARKNDARNL